MAKAIGCVLLGLAHPVAPCAWPIRSGVPKRVIAQLRSFGRRVDVRTLGLRPRQQVRTGIESRGTLFARAQRSDSFFLWFMVLGSWFLVRWRFVFFWWRFVNDSCTNRSLELTIRFPFH